MFDFMQPVPHQPLLPGDEVRRRYPWYRFQVFCSVFLGYAAYYVTRSNFPLAAPLLIEKLGCSKSDIGNIRAAMGITYGLSKFVMGTVSDRSNPRFFMALGLLLSGIVNFLLPVAGGVGTMFVLMLFNGWFQGMGWPPCGRTITHWFSCSERGSTMGVWNVAHNVGGGIVAPISVWALGTYGWPGVFYVPGVIAVAMSLFILVTLRDTPQSVGLPAIEDYRNDYPAVSAGTDRERELTSREILFTYVLTNKYVWLLAVANAFVYCVRYGVVDWSPTYLQQVKHLSLQNAGWAFLLYEYAGIPGTLLAGWLSDKVFRGRRSPVAFIFMALTLIATFVYWKNPAGNPTVDLVALSAIGFLIYGPVMLIGVSALDMVPKKAAGTAAGFTGMFGYLLGTVGASSGLGYAVDAYGWDAGFQILIGACVLSMAVLLSTWNFRATSAKAST